MELWCDFHYAENIIIGICSFDVLLNQWEIPMIHVIVRSYCLLQQLHHITNIIVQQTIFQYIVQQYFKVYISINYYLLCCKYSDKNKQRQAAKILICTVLLVLHLSCVLYWTLQQFQIKYHILQSVCIPEEDTDTSSNWSHFWECEHFVSG